MVVYESFTNKCAYSHYSLYLNLPSSLFPVPPSIDGDSASPSNQSVIMGQPIYINCPVTGKPPPRVNWLKDGEPLSVDLDPNLRLLVEGRRLEVLSARIIDRGRYTCIGESVAGEVAKDFDLDVYG